MADIEVTDRRVVHLDPAEIRAWQAGDQAHDDGLLMGANPHDPDADPDLWRAWQSGYRYIDPPERPRVRVETPGAGGAHRTRCAGVDLVQLGIDVKRGSARHALPSLRPVQAVSRIAVGAVVGVLLMALVVAVVL